MEKITMNGRTVIWHDKVLISKKDGVLNFEDGDWVNTVTGAGIHCYGMLSVTGSSTIGHPLLGDSYTETRRGTYTMTFPKV